jgi:2-isopropylmalate synthase
MGEIMASQSSFFCVRSYKVLAVGGDDRLDTCEATVKVIIPDKATEELEVADGCGPIYALDCALRKALNKHFPCLNWVKLIGYDVHLDDEKGSASDVRVTIEFSNGLDNWSTQAASRNIIAASLYALVSGFEQAILKKEAAAVA